MKIRIRIMIIIRIRIRIRIMRRVVLMRIRILNRLIILMFERIMVKHMVWNIVVAKTNYHIFFSNFWPRARAQRGSSEVPGTLGPSWDPPYGRNGVCHSQ